ncbi:MAG: phosphoglycerate mutase, partial [Planctomycetota bacterium]
LRIYDPFDVFTIEGEDEPSRRSAELIRGFLEQTRALLEGEAKANGLLLRGFSSLPPIDGYRERYNLRAAAIAIYPMYRGVARLAGMEVLEPGGDLAAQIAAARDRLDDFDFFFIHTKGPDTAGHGGEFERKVAALEEIDPHIPALTDLGTEVVIVTGDHSTPCVHREHSWHPVPVIISSRRSIPVEGTTFSERGVLAGDLGTFPAPALMQLALAHAGRLDKFGA